MSYQPAPLQTTVIGSYPQPDWLVDKKLLHTQFVPRVRNDELWLVNAEARNKALQEATLMAIRDMEAAGIDVITDGEISRESYSNHFSASLEGFDVDNPATIVSRIGHQVRVPRVVGPIRYRGPVEIESAKFLRGNTRRLTKITLPGPFTLSQQVKDEYYKDPVALALDFAAAVNQEAKALQDVGIDVIQLDEPWLRNDPDGARRYAIKALDRALEGVNVRKALHMCFGYAFLHPGNKPKAYEYLTELGDSVVDEISIEAAQPDLDLGVLAGMKGKVIALGVLNHSTTEPESVAIVADRIRAALKYLPPNQLVPAPDCGMKYMSRDGAFNRLKNLSSAASLVRGELG